MLKQAAYPLCLLISANQEIKPKNELKFHIYTAISM